MQRNWDDDFVELGDALMPNGEGDYINKDTGYKFLSDGSVLDGNNELVYDPEDLEDGTFFGGDEYGWINDPSADPF